jgi:hypothetical protein
MEISRISTAVLSAVSIVVGAFCVNDSIEARTFFGSELAVSAVAYVGIGAIGIILLFWYRSVRGDSPELRRIAAGVAAAFILTSLWTLWMLSGIYGSE